MQRTDSKDIQARREGRQSVMTSDLIALMGCCILRPLCKSLPSMSLQARHLP